MKYSLQAVIVFCLGSFILGGYTGWILFGVLATKSIHNRIKCISNVKYNVNKFDDDNRKRSLSSWWRVSK